MQASLIEFLGSQPLMRVVRGLLLSPQPLHVRDLAARYSLSPSGVVDIARRLKDAGVLKETRRGNKRALSLELTSAERECLKSFFRIAEISLLEERAARFGLNAQDKLRWMDEAYTYFREVRRSRT